MQVQELIAGLVYHYPEAGHNGATLRGICEDYFEDFTEDRTSAEEFTQIVKLARKRCKFFPKVSDLMELRNELRANPIRKPVSGLIEEESLVKTPEMMEAGKRNCKLISMMLKYGISHEDAQKKMLNDAPQLRVVGGRG